MTRLDILKALIKDRFGDRKAEFAQAIGKSPSQVSQLLSGHRKIGDATVRNIEIQLNLPQGYFDNPGLSVQSTQGTYHVKKTKQCKTRPLAQKLCALADCIDDEGLRQAISYMEFLRTAHPAVKAKPAAYS